MTRLSFAWALCAALAACVKSTTLQKFVVLDPIFDSVFVGNQKPLPSVIYFDGDKLQTPPASAVTWQSSDPTILAVNNPSGQIKGLKRGTASVSATVENTQGSEIVVVPDVVDITLDRKSTRLNSSHGYISYAVFCLKKKKKALHLVEKDTT